MNYCLWKTSTFLFFSNLIILIWNNLFLHMRMKNDYICYFLSSYFSFAPNTWNLFSSHFFTFLFSSLHSLIQSITLLTDIITRFPFFLFPRFDVTIPLSLAMFSLKFGPPTSSYITQSIIRSLMMHLTTSGIKSVTNTTFHLLKIKMKVNKT